MLAIACKGTVIAFKQKQANEDKALVSAKRCNAFLLDGHISNKARRSTISESKSACMLPAAINNMQSDMFNNTLCQKTKIPEVGRD
jgi:hypothetical protein